MISNKWSKTFNSKPIFLITGNFTKISTFRKKLKNALFFKNKVLVLRIKNSDVDIDEAFSISKKFCKKNSIPLILNIQNKFNLKADGYHLQAKELKKKYFHTPNMIIGASCHNEEELLAAKKLGCDYIFLSPVVKKNDFRALGWETFFKLKNSFPELKIIPLGGVNEKNSMQDSYAGISHWWDLQSPL